MSDPAESAEKPGFVEELRLAGEKIHPLRSRSSGSASVEPLRILVLEDMPGEAVVIVRELRRGGLHFRSRRVETEEDFRRELLDFAPDLILADFSLPQVTAFDAMRVLAETRSGVPFILVTSARSEEIAVECMKRGADDYILKDNLMRLPSAVRNAVAKSRANRERRRAEAALRRSERRYRLIAENTRDLILVIDRRGRILYASAASAALLGRLPEDLFKTDALDLIHPDDRERAAEAFRPSMAGDAAPLEVRVQAQGREWPVFEVVGGWVFDQQDRPHRGVAVLRDITERHRSEERIREVNAALSARERELSETLSALKQSHEQLQGAYLQLIQADKMESIGRVAAGVAHEVKNPLTVILMGVEYLSRILGPGDPEMQNILHDMDEAVMRTNRVIRALLEYSGPGGLELKPADLNEVIREALELIRHEFVRKRIRVATELAEGLPSSLLDRTKIQHLFVNLLVNAVEATPEGGFVTIRTSKRSGRHLTGSDAAPAVNLLPSARPIVVAEVEDTGCGIPPDLLERVFDPFFTTRAAANGTGLGLTVIREIVKLHRGAFAIENRETGGVRATVGFRAYRIAQVPDRRSAF